MAPWLIHSIIAVFATGAYMALFKVPSSHGHNKYTYSFLGFVAATAASYISFYKSIHIEYNAILYSVLWGIAFSVLIMLQMELLRKLDTNALFPITSISSHVLVVIIGVTFFHDNISAIQFTGIIATFLIISFYNRIHRHITLSSGILPFMLAIVLISTTSKFLQKFGSLQTSVENFIFWQLFFAMVGSFVILLVARGKELGVTVRESKKIILWAAGMGVLNFIATAHITKALSTGPFSLVFTVNSFYTLITSLIAWRFFGEDLTKRKVLFLLAAICTVILIALG